jgi:hypothetical protein
MDAILLKTRRILPLTVYSNLQYILLQIAIVQKQPGTRQALDA